jgi:hypothetical protein
VTPAPAGPLAGLADGALVERAGMAAVVIDQRTRQERDWATVVLETEDGDVTVLVYPKAFDTIPRGELRAGTRWHITGRVDRRVPGEPRLMAITVQPLV